MVRSAHLALRLLYYTLFHCPHIFYSFLAQAEFDIQREAFEQGLYDAGLSPLYGVEAATPSPDSAYTAATASDANMANISGVDPVGVVGSEDGNTAKPRRRTVPYRHSLKFEDLVYPPVRVLYSCYIAVHSFMRCLFGLFYIVLFCVRSYFEVEMAQVGK